MVVHTHVQVRKEPNFPRNKVFPTLPTIQNTRRVWYCNPETQGHASFNFSSSSLFSHSNFLEFLWACQILAWFSSQVVCHYRPRVISNKVFVWHKVLHQTRNHHTIHKISQCSPRPGPSYLPFFENVCHSRSLVQIPQLFIFINAWVKLASSSVFLPTLII